MSAGYQVERNSAPGWQVHTVIEVLCILIALLLSQILVPQAAFGTETAPDTTGTGDRNAEKLKQLIEQYDRYDVSFDPKPVSFFINGTLFTVPRNYVTQLPVHGFIDPTASRSEPQSEPDLVSIDFIFPSLSGLMPDNAECFLAGSGCSDVVRLVISSSPESPPQDYFSGPLIAIRDRAIAVTDDLWALPLRSERTTSQHYVARLADREEVLLECNRLPLFNGKPLVPLCMLRTSFGAGVGYVILFNDEYLLRWRDVYEAVRKMTASFRREE